MGKVGIHLTVHFPKCGAECLFIAQGRGHGSNGGVEIANLGISSQNKLFLSFLERARFKKVGPEKRKRREVLQIPQ